MENLIYSDQSTLSQIGNCVALVCIIAAGFLSAFKHMKKILWGVGLGMIASIVYCLSTVFEFVTIAGFNPHMFVTKTGFWFVFFLFFFAMNLVLRRKRPKLS